MYIHLDFQFFHENKVINSLTLTLTWLGTKHAVVLEMAGYSMIVPNKGATGVSIVIFKKVEIPGVFLISK